MCDFAVDVPLEGDIDITGRINRVTAEVGHVLASTIWTLPTVDSGGGGDESRSNIDKDKHPGMLYVETLVSSAAVNVGSEGFAVLQATHVRTVSTVPLGMGTTLASCVDGRGFRGVASDTERDELAEKAREKMSRGAGSVTASLPARPDMWREDGASDSSRGGDISERIHMGVTVSPIRLNLTEPHLLGLTCLALDISARLSEISTALCASPVQEEPTHDEGEPASDVTPLDVASNVFDLEGQVPRQDFSASSRSHGTPASDFDDTKSAGNGSRTMATCNRPSSLLSTASTRGRRSGEAFAVAASSPPRSSGIETLTGNRESQQEADVSARDSQGPVGPPPTEDVGPDDALSDEVLGEQLPGEIEPPAARANGIEEAPIPPAFLGTLIVDAVSVMLLKDTGGANDGAGLSAYSDGCVGVDGAQQHPRATGASSSSSCPPLPAFTNHEPYERGASATSTPNQRYSPVMHLDVHGIGIGMDLPQQATPGARAQPLTEDVPPVADGDIGTGCELRAELAIKSVSVTDVSDGRCISLGHAVHNGAPVGGAGVRRERGCNSRVLPAGWWNHIGGSNSIGDASGDTGDYDELVLLQVRMCTASNTVSVDANLAPACMWLLPAPILDVANLVASLSRDVGKYARCRHAGRIGSGDGGDGRRNVVSAPEIGGQSGARDGASSPKAPSRRCSDAYRLEPWMLRTDNLRENSDIGQTTRTPSLPPVLSLPWEVAGGRAGAIGNIEDDATPIRRHNHAYEPRTTNRPSWRRITRALSGTTLPEFLWLKRIDVSASARGLQLWLPNVESGGNAAVGVPAARHAGGIAAAAGPAAAASQNVPGFEAVVVSCRSWHMAVSIAVSMLSDDAISGPFEDSPVTAPDEGILGARPAEVGGEDEDHNYDRATEGLAGRGDGMAGGAAANDAAAVAVIGPGNELCVMSVGIHGLEVFVARPSMEDSGPSAEQPAALRGDIEGETGEGASHFGAARPPCNPSRVTDTVSRGQEEIASSALDATETRTHGAAGASRWRQRKPSVDPMRWPAFRGSSGASESDVTSEGNVSVETSATGSGLDLGVDGAGGRSLQSCSSNTEGLILPFSADLKHVLLVRSPSSALGPRDPPLFSELKVSVTAIQATLFLDFPLAARIMESSIGPVLEGVSSFAEENQGRGNGDDGGDGTREGCADEGSQGGRRQDSVSAEANERDSMPVRGVSGTLPVPRAPQSSGADDLRDKEDARTEAVVAAPAVASELLALWACRVGIVVEGLRVKVVNNFYLQNRPCLKINVSKLMHPPSSILNC